MRTSLLASLALIIIAGSLGFAVLAALAASQAQKLGRRATAHMSGSLQQTFILADVRHLQQRIMLAGLATMAACWAITTSWRMALLLAAGFACLPWAALWLWRRRRLQDFRRQTPDTLSLLAEGLRSGGAFNQMLHQVSQRMPAPTSQELGLVVRQLRLGVPLEQALSELDQRMKTEETRLLMAILQMGAASGGQLAESLDSLSDATRRKLALEDKVRALTAQGRLQAWVMGALPFLLALVLYQIDPASMRLLVDSRVGQVVLFGVLLLQCCGALLIRRIASIEW